MASTSLAQLRQLARQAQDLHPQLLEARADVRVAGHEARAGERLVLEHPGLAALVLRERIERLTSRPLAPSGRSRRSVSYSTPAGVKLVSQVLMRCASRA